MNVLFVIINIINLVSFVESFGACQTGCGTQDITSQPADRICEGPQIEILDTVLSSKDSAQCKALRIRNNNRCRFINRIRIADNQAIHVSQTEGARFYTVFTPGFHSDRCYNDAFFCAFEITCERDEILYYHITEHDIESPTKNKDCLDQFAIEREGELGSFHKSCGRVGNKNRDFVNLNDLPISVSGIRNRNGFLVTTFFSGRACSACGYFMFAECVKMSSQDTIGCENGEIKKRQSTDRFNERFPFLSHTMTVKNFEIRQGENFTYTSNTVRSGLNLFTLDKIWALLLFHREKGQLVYYRGTLQTFFGYGILRIRNGLALYVDYDAPPRFHPTEDEENYLSEILSVLTFEFTGQDYTIVDLDSPNGTQPTTTSRTPPVSTPIFPSNPFTTTTNFVLPTVTPTHTPTLIPTPVPDPPMNPCAKASGLQSIQQLCEESLVRVNSCNGIVKENAQFFLNTKCVDI